MDPHLYHAHLDTLRQVPRSPVLQDDEFAAFMAYDYGRRRRLHPDVGWEAACRAYAFAAASYAEHAGALDLDTELRLEDHWDRLRGEAGPDWPVARTLLREAWHWLDEHGDTMAASRSAVTWAAHDGTTNGWPFVVRTVVFLGAGAKTTTRTGKGVDHAPPWGGRVTRCHRGPCDSIRCREGQTQAAVMALQAAFHPTGPLSARSCTMEGSSCPACPIRSPTRGRTPPCPAP